MDFLVLLRILLIIFIIACFVLITVLITWLTRIMRQVSKNVDATKIVNDSMQTVLDEMQEDRTSLQNAVNEYGDRIKNQSDSLDEYINELKMSLDNYESWDNQIKSLNIKVDSLGARWGIKSESAFREGMRSILREAGYSVEKYRIQDKEGVIYGHPGELVEIDVIIKNGKTWLVEIKSRIERSEVATFHKLTQFYESKENKTADTKILISPFIDNPAVALAKHLGITVCTDATALN